MRVLHLLRMIFLQTARTEMGFADVQHFTISVVKISSPPEANVLAIRFRFNAIIKERNDDEGHSFLV